MIQLIKEKFLKNKFSIVTIAILPIIIIFMQTKLSFKDSKIENLNMKIKKLQENNTYFEKLKQRFVEIGEMKNKTYNENLNGKVVNIFSWIDKFEVNDNQIENLLKGLSKKNLK
ncbi:TPA: hypothetical protein I9Z77_003215 [Clostridium perfringens]|nr:hypothetical protein [Clostridium perfringens]